MNDMLVEYVSDVFQNNPVMKSYYNHLYDRFNPNITGYTLAFMVPPHLSGIESGGSFIQNFQNQNKVDVDHYAIFDSYEDSIPLMSFAAADFTPPQTQTITAQVTPRTGGVPWATDVATSENCSVVYVDNLYNSVYLYHLLWIEYMRAISGGAFYDYSSGGWQAIKPSNDYLRPGNGRFATIDYAASIYFVKYMPDMNTITYIGKVLGCFPTGLPSKELIGTKTSNELAMISFDYVLGGFREYISFNNTNKWIYDELQQQVISSFPTDGHTAVTDSTLQTDTMLAWLGHDHQTTMMG